MSQEDLIKFLDLGNIPIDTVLRNAESRERPEMCPYGWVILNEYPFRLGLRLPFRP